MPTKYPEQDQLVILVKMILQTLFYEMFPICSPCTHGRWSPDFGHPLKGRSSGRS